MSGVDSFHAVQVLPSSEQAGSLFPALLAPWDNPDTKEIPMKTIAYILALLCLVALAVLLAACGGTAVPTQTVPDLGLEPAPWANGSTAAYQWLDTSGLIGTSEYTFTLAADVWTITDRDLIGQLDQTIAMSVSATTLAPLGEKKSIHTSDSDVLLTTSYSNGKLNITADVNGQTQTASLDVPANSLDNDQLLMTLRALPFAQGYTTHYVIVVAQNALKVDTTVTVQAQETIEVPAGSFVVWPVEMSFGNTKQTAWYEIAAPHQLVQYYNGSTRMVLASD
jgi:hypothetical protein